MQIRPIEQKDDAELGRIIREVLTEFGANKPGFAWQDPELDAMTQAYEPKGRVYKVADDGLILGGAGIAEFNCDLGACCELQKMYLLPEARKRGLGQHLMTELLEDAKTLGYQYCYLETLASMTGAIRLYEKSGFELLSSPLGDSGHNACDQWYLLKL